MKKLIFVSALFLSPVCFAGGPIYQHSAPEIQREFQNVYQEIGQKLSTATFSFSIDCASVTCAGSTYNGAGQLLQLNGSGKIPNSALDSSSVTLQGNTFNGNSQLIKTDSSGGIAFPGINTQALQPSFLAQNSTTDSDVTGDNTTVTVDFDTEVYDITNNFASDTFTAPVTGKYFLSTSVTTRDTASGNKCELSIVTSNRTYTQEVWPTSNIALNFSVLADMDSADTAAVQLNCSGGLLVVDVLGNGGSTTGTGMPTFFSGTLIN